MKRTTLLLILVVLCLGAKAQEAAPLSETEAQKVTAALTETATAMQNLQCRFVQQKTSSMLAEPTVSEGVMAYAAPDKLRWEYTAPYPFALLVEGEQIVKVTDGKTEKLDGKSGRMYQGMVDLIMGSASGKQLFDASVFDVTLYDDELYWKAEMTPKRRDMKRMFKQLVFRFDKKTNTINSVEFIESGGDVTSIQFKDLKINSNDGLF
ncbi:MAG: outer membrane lipoprotein carrier protein LolA [Bacteroidales bacterium]|nr:outer membrane lipoprotein carrier protein LolA [Bacteroidales bacterium]